MTRSPGSLVPSGGRQQRSGKRDDKASGGRQGGEANSRAATQVNAVSASSTPPAITPIQLELFPRRACPLEAKPVTVRKSASAGPVRRDGVEGGSTRRKQTKITGEPLFGSEEAWIYSDREAHKGEPRKRRNDAGQGVGGGHSTEELRDNRREGRVATSTTRSKQGKAAGLPPRGKARTRSKPQKRMDKARKLQRTLYRAAKLQPERRFTKLFDKVCDPETLREAWERVKRKGGAGGVDKVGVDAVVEYGEERFLREIREAVRSETYRASDVRRVHIPKPGQPGKTRPLGIPTVKDRVVQMAVKLVIEPLFEADFRPSSYGFRPKRTQRMALNAIVEAVHAKHHQVVDVDLRSYFDTIDHELLLQLVERRVGDIRVLRLIRAWLKAGVLEDGQVRHPIQGTPQGGVISPLLSNVYLHQIDELMEKVGGNLGIIHVRYADDMVLLARTEKGAMEGWAQLQQGFQALKLSVNEEKSRITTTEEGFAFLGFEFRRRPQGSLYLWPRKKAEMHVLQRVRETTRSIASSESLKEVIRKLNPILNGWCTYFRVGNSNRVFHSVDWAVRSEIQLWLRRKHRCSWITAKGRWHYRMLHEKCGLYRMVGKVSHLEALQ